jgi:O-antigen ligase
VIVALLQITSGDSSPFYTYHVTNRGGAVGLFANRNHQALFLASAFPLLALWSTLPGDDLQRIRLRRLLCATAAAFLLPMLAVTGSRAGLILGLLGLGFAWFQFRTGRSDPTALGRRRSARRWVWIPFAVAAAVAVGSAIMLSRAEAIDRLLATSFKDELRLQYLPLVLRITGDFFPFGTGFGSFDGIFRIYEPIDLLQAQYFNHAHNDLAELVMTGGLPALLVFIGFLAWLTRRGLAILRDNSRERRTQFARLGLGQVVLILVASLFDYPLRTPMIGVLFVLACGWVAGHRQRA